MDASNIERLALAHVLQSDKAIASFVRRGFDPDEIFRENADGSRTAEHSLLRCAIGVYKRYRTRLTEQSLEIILGRLRVKDKARGPIMAVFTLAKDEPIDESETEIIFDELKVMLGARKYSELLGAVQSLSWDEAVLAMKENIGDVAKYLEDDETVWRRVRMDESTDSFLKEYDTNLNDPDLRNTVLSGVKSLDDTTGGFAKGQLVSLLAPSSGGKSLVLIDWAIRAHLAGHDVLYFSFEMDAWQVQKRYIAHVSGVDYSKLHKYEITEDDKASITNALTRIQSDKAGAFLIDDQLDDPTPDYIESAIEDFKRTTGRTPTLIVVDYIGNMTVRNATPAMRHHEIQALAAQGLFKLAKRQHVVVLTAQQVNRSMFSENRQAKKKGEAIQILQDAASGSQQLVYLSSYVFGIESNRPENQMFLHPSKMREGNLLTPIELSVDAQHYSITEVDPIVPPDFDTSSLSGVSKIGAGHSDPYDMDEADLILDDDLVAPLGI